jgi:hypothetical protein
MVSTTTMISLISSVHKVESFVQNVRVRGFKNQEFTVVNDWFLKRE